MLIAAGASAAGEEADKRTGPRRSTIAREELDASAVTEQGLLGARAYALVDAETGKVASAKNPKRWLNLFQCHAALTEPPQTARVLPSVRITLPDGSTVTSDDPDADDALSEVHRRHHR